MFCRIKIYFKRQFFLRVLFNPSYWILNSPPPNEEWDGELNKMLDNPEFGRIDSHTCNLNGKTIWIENFPYAYGSPWANHRYHGKDILPKRRTILKLYDALESHKKWTKIFNL